MNATQFVSHANRLADISRDIIREEIYRPREVTVKSDATPVTPIDQKVERALREAITEMFPEHGIVGEEYDNIDSDSDYVWVLDPIDGTMAFIAGLPTFATLIALTWRGSPILGVMDSPITQERWIGVDGVSTTLNGAVIQSRPCHSLDSAFAHTSSPLYFVSESDIAAYERITKAVQFLIFGGGCHAFGRVAHGYIDIAFETAHDIHDYLALVPIINNAGGSMSDWQGNPLTLSSGPRFLACGDQAMHSQALKILNG
ncbi:MAG: inositol monophosphatase family protein [Pseudomonadales bacterium]|jgi:inositol-phosphate phosphatase/L-galactose 1-phosphate phosphatase/histidinol-phosphatase|tara:strand:- start:79 stop:852 length:774 start_codon:yes stop_codon:yes gene_type:complete